MKQTYANLFVFACSQCNRPLVFVNYSDAEHDLGYFGAAPIQLDCDRCLWKGEFLAMNAIFFQSVEWNLEIRSVFRT